MLQKSLTILLLAGTACGHAATLTLPSVTIVSPPSTAITCSSNASSPLLGTAGEVEFNCTVTPSTWKGAASISNNQFVITNLSGASFNVAVGSTALSPGTYQPGTVTTAP
jgi:hypothetical protein